MQRDKESGYIHCDSDNHVNSAIEIVEDVTDQHQTQVELESAYQRFQDIALSCNDIIWEVDLEGCFVFLSDNIHTYTGLKPEVLI